MRTFILISSVISVLISNCAGNKNTSDNTKCYDGKLVKSGICNQRVIMILNSNKEGIDYARNWTDTLSGKQYNDVFTVTNHCDFPATIKEGDSFTFSVVSTGNSNCVICQAFTPVPLENNNIVVDCKRTQE